jgi:hypothetical protein
MEHLFYEFPVSVTSGILLLKYNVSYLGTGIFLSTEISRHTPCIWQAVSKYTTSYAMWSLSVVLKEVVMGLYPEPDETFQPISEWSILTLPKLYLISRFVTEICIDFSSLPSCHIPYTFHPPANNRLYNIWEPIIKCLST